jgi:hypothetical protein
MIQTAVGHADAARRAEAEIGKPAVADSVTTETGPAGFTAEPRGDVIEAGSEKPVPEIEKGSTGIEAVAQPEVVPVLAVSPALAETPEPAADACENQFQTEHDSPGAAIAFGNLRRCEACGFPVSEGRRLCLDCEAATPDSVAGAGNSPELFGELAESNQSWIRSHVYLIATAVIAAATIALLAWRL